MLKIYWSHAGFYSFLKKIFFQISSNEMEDFHDYSTNAIKMFPILKKNTSHVKIKSFHWRGWCSKSRALPQMRVRVRSAGIHGDFF